MTDFHETRFPVDIALKSRGGPERRTDVVTLGSGRETRNARWSRSRRRFDAGYGVKSLSALAAVVAFFEERRGMLYGFRFRDRADFKSCALDGAPGPLDQAATSFLPKAAVSSIAVSRCSTISAKPSPFTVTKKT